ncbi:hypothetical protein [Pedobacter sp. ASV28]|uniref:hypothetical protein n=1 Tax=Pedobacter sp. ASV28 TaxID=2795123 RepID=UPI0018EB1229|nr:hypothetical protein [Pedobacter sp. ASV28]
MKKQFVFLMISLIFFCACQSSTSEKESDQAGLDSNLAPTAQQNCYAYIKGKDTATLTLLTSGMVSTGELHYKWFEKDNNSGTIAGEMHGDTLIASYTFNAEGKQSSRQVVFLKRGDQLLEGFGEVTEKEGKVIFKDVSKLNFGQALVFEQVACK